MKTFIDFTETTITPGRNHDFFLCASITILDRQISEFEQCLVTAKKAVGLPSHAPVKSNLNDTSLTQWCANYGLINELEIARHQSHLLRETLIDELNKLSPLPKTVCCAWNWYNPRKLRIPLWCFNNTLQRIGLIHKANTDKTHSVEIDWPGDDNRKYLGEIYEKAWLDGKSATCKSTYICGPLRSLGFKRGPTYCPCLQHPGIQVVDILLGIYTVFAKNSLRNEPRSKSAYLVKKSLGLFHRDKAGNLWRRGFIARKALEDKMQEVYPWFN